MAALTGTMYFTPTRPSGSSSVSAASGPYAAELSASRPKIGMPAIGPICSARSSLVASGRPNSSLKIRLKNSIEAVVRRLKEGEEVAEGIVSPGEHQIDKSAGSQAY